MCTLGFEESDYELGLPKSQEDRSNGDTTAADATFCAKCGQRDVKLLRKRKNQYCEVCFLVSTTHKFRATLGKSKVVRRDESVLFGCSGKENSTVLAHLIKAAQNESVGKKLPFRCTMLYIDDGAIKGRTDGERRHILYRMARWAEDCGLTGYVVPLNKSGNLCEHVRRIDEPYLDNTREDAALRETIDALENETAKDEFVRQLRRKILVSVAQKLECTKVFVADSSIDLATKVLADISTGRGARLSFDVGFLDTRSPNVTLLRPLRDFTNEEISGYLSCHGLIPVFDSLKRTRAFPASIRNVTHNFVSWIDSEFHSATSTIYRTGEKLTARPVLTDSQPSIPTIEDINDVHPDRENICLLCQVPLDKYNTRDQQLSAVQAKAFSELTSVGKNLFSCSAKNLVNESTSSKEVQLNKDVENKKCLRDKVSCCTTQCTDSFTDGSEVRPILTLEMLETYLCYGCKLIFSKFNAEPNLLPDFMLDGIREKLQFRRMRKEIADFLI